MITPLFTKTLVFGVSPIKMKGDRFCELDPSPHLGFTIFILIKKLIATK